MNYVIESKRMRVMRDLTARQVAILRVPPEHRHLLKFTRDPRFWGSGGVEDTEVSWTPLTAQI